MNMGWFSGEPEKKEVSNMKEVKRSLMDALDSIEEELEQIKSDIEAKRDEKAVLDSDIRDYQHQFQRKQTEANRLEVAIATISGKRAR